MTSTTIITPTIGSDELFDACQSVANQSVPALHLIVVDGKQYYDRVMEVVMAVHMDNPSSYNYAELVLPFNTGADGVNGHRAYAAASNISVTPFFSFLDQDNYLAYDWVHKMQQALDRNEQSQYVTCRRTIVDANKEIIGLDNKESVGNSELGYKLYDTNTFIFRRSMALLTPYMAIRYYKDAPEKRLGDRDLTNTIWNVPHTHLEHYHGTHYRSPEHLIPFFKEVCND